jgi:hypothetical protein
MKINTLPSIFLFCVLLFSMACNQDKTSSTPLNPNGDSELAILMRAMAEDGERMKEHILSGKMPSPKADYDKLLTAEATEPDKMTTPEYEAFAQSYIQIMEAMEKGEKENADMLYKNMVDVCMNCHRAVCPGPMVRIKKLYVNK